MKNLFTYLKTLWGAWGNLQSNDAICDRWLTIVRLSFKTAKTRYRFGTPADHRSWECVIKMLCPVGKRK